MQKLAHEALDEVRRAEVQKATTKDGRKALKRTRWPLQKNPWNLTKLESEKLAKLPRANKRLFRAYLLKEALRRSPASSTASRSTSPGASSANGPRGPRGLGSTHSAS